MKNLQSRQIKKVSNALILILKKKYGFLNYSLFINAWDDGDFQITLSSTTFLDGLQKDEVRKESCRVRVIEIASYHGQITENIIEKIHKPSKREN